MHLPFHRYFEVIDFVQINLSCNISENASCPFKISAKFLSPVYFVTPGLMMKESISDNASTCQSHPIATAQQPLA